MQKKNTILNNKGITLITLVVTVLIMLIISTVIIYNTTNHFKINNLNKMYNDIRLLNQQVLLYYSKYQELPIIEENYQSDIPQNILEGYDTKDFNILDINKIGKNIKSNLNYGKDYYSKNYFGTDIYIINKLTNQIFYVKGVKVDDVVYYTIPGENDIYKPLEKTSLIANLPIIEDNLEPIKYDENSDTKIIGINQYDENWYDYSKNTNLLTWARARGKSDTDIYMWVPRYIYNDKTNQIVFLKGTTDEAIKENVDITGANWKIPDAFKNKEKEELTGIWLYIGADYKKINTITELIKEVYELTGKDNINGTTSTTITSGEYTYYNPMIPAGYKTISTKNASWRSTNGVYVDGWNDGLVIEDKNGNQFVWVPGNNITSSIGATEQTQIDKYGGFYRKKNGTQILEI